jgi:dihydroxy-acid dehydratase
MNNKLNKNSKNMTEGKERMPNRAMLRAVGFKDNDFEKPIIGVASSGSDVSPCNMHHNDLADLANKQTTKEKWSYYYFKRKFS